MATIKRRAGGTNSTVLIRREYSTAFSPTSIAGCQLWLDGADPAANGVIPANGATISTWNDKSGNGKNGAATGTPTYLTGGGINFNGSSYFLNQAFSQNLSQRSIFIVMQETTRTIYSGIFTFIPTPNSGNDQSLLTYETTNGFQFYGEGYSSTIGNSTLLVKAIYNDNMNVRTGSGYLNGTNATNVTASATAGTSSGYTVGGRWQSGSMSGSYRLNGIIYEIIVFNTPLSTNNRQTIESYLAQKWGLIGALPSGHSQFSQPAGKPNNINNPILGLFPIIKPSTFSPLSIPGSQLWMDSSDSSSASMTLSGSNVTQWRDKSGNGNNTTAVSGTPNLTANAIGGKSAISMSGGYFTGPFATANTGTQVHAFAVLSINSAGTGLWPRPLSLGRPGVNDYASSTTTFAIIRYSGTQAVAIGRNGQYLSVNFPTYDTPFLVQSSHNGPTEFMSVNGNLTVSSLNTGQTGNFDITSYGLGVNTNTSDYFVWNGYYGEVIYYNVQLSTDNRQKIEGYLAWKWGLQGNLPVGHPYYSAAP